MWMNRFCGRWSRISSPTSCGFRSRSAPRGPDGLRIAGTFEPRHRFSSGDRIARAYHHQLEAVKVIQAVGRVRFATRPREVITFQCGELPGIILDRRILHPPGGSATTLISSPARSSIVNCSSGNLAAPKRRTDREGNLPTIGSLGAHGLLPAPGGTLAGGSAMTYAGLAPEWIERLESLNTLNDQVISLPSPASHVPT